MLNNQNNLAFIDGQNLYLGTTKSNNKWNKVILISGDGDYKMLVDFLIEEDRFEKILFPNKKFASSLYKKLSTTYYDYLENKEVKNKIKKGPLR